MRLTEFLDADEQAANGASGSQNNEPRWESISAHDDDGPFDKLDKTASWDDIFVYGANYTKLNRAPDSQTLAAYKRPGAESDYSVKILKDNPHVAVVHSDMCGLPTGGRQKLTKGRICAIWYHNGDERAAAAAMLNGAASYLPQHIQDAVRGSDRRDQSTYNGLDREPPEDGMPADDAYQDQRVPDHAAIFAEEVEREARRIRVRDAAQRKIRREQQRDLGNLEPIALDDFLAIPDEPVEYRIDGVWPSGGRIVLAAQWKVGKTTLTGNVIRALADGALFLDRFRTQPAEVTLLDFEMDPRKIRQWLRDQQVKYASHVHVIALRGKVSSFDILDPVIRSQWAARIRGSDVAIFDCLRPILDALGLDENREAGRLLMAIDELLNEAEVPEALIVHHMGHTGERSRGDSRIIDWPDATWKVVRENPDLENSPRYFSAYGRDVYQAESLLEYNSETRRLALVGGNRRDASNTRLLPPLLEILRGDEDGMSGRQLDDAMVAAGHGRNASRDARQYAVLHGHVVTIPGKARAVIHKLPAESAPVRHSAPVGVAHHASESGEECASAPIDGALTTTTLAPAADQESAPAHTQESAADPTIETIQSLLPGAEIIDEDSA
jgi:hypothetical protein